ncbi:MAG: hypothetical protein IT285_15155 [Bdellovibrionales bacterium]|nr:hypothetical protein [Bdellovibrionales bacterium]
MRLIGMAALAAIVFSGCRGNSVLMLVPDGKGGWDQERVPAQEYEARVSQVGAVVEASSLETIEKEARERDGWAVRTVAIGVGATAEIGVADWKVGIAPKTRVFFTNNAKPQLP